MAEYSTRKLSSIYELGRMYYEMGYFAPAERIFSGLLAVDQGATPSLVGMGLVKIELGLFEDATKYFRAAVQRGSFTLQARYGMAAAFIAAGDDARAKSLLMQIQQDGSRAADSDPNLDVLWSALNARCSE